MDVEADKLITLVQARPVLYNYTLADYYNREVTDKVWEDVGKELNAKGTDCKSKWQGLRCSYNRYLRDLKYTPPSGYGALKKKKYYLADAMSFLHDFLGQHKKMANRLDGGSTSNQNMSNSLHSSSENEIILDNTERLEEEVVQPNVQQSEHKKNKHSKKSVPVMEIVAQPMADFLKARAKVSYESQDPNLNFFKGILPEVAKLNPRRTRQFKEKVMSMLNQLLDEQEEEELRQRPSSVASVLSETSSKYPSRPSSLLSTTSGSPGQIDRLTLQPTVTSSEIYPLNSATSWSLT